MSLDCEPRPLEPGELPSAMGWRSPSPTPTTQRLMKRRLSPGRVWGPDLWTGDAARSYYPRYCVACTHQALKVVQYPVCAMDFWYDFCVLIFLKIVSNYINSFLYQLNNTIQKRILILNDQIQTANEFNNRLRKLLSTKFATQNFSYTFQRSIPN